MNALMELNYNDLKQLIKDSVVEVLNEEGGPPNCPVNFNGELTPQQHKYHHKIVDSMKKDMDKIRTGVIVGILVLAFSGIGTFLWNIFGIEGGV